MASLWLRDARARFKTDRETDFLSRRRNLACGCFEPRQSAYRAGAGKPMTVTNMRVHEKLFEECRRESGPRARLGICARLLDDWAGAESVAFNEHERVP